MIDVNSACNAALLPRIGNGTPTAWGAYEAVDRVLTVVSPAKKEGSKARDAIGTNLRFAAGQTVFYADDDADNFYEVLSGTISISNHMVDGRRQILEFLSPGDLFGLTGEDKYPHTAEAASKVIVVRYRGRDLETRVGNNPALARHLLAAVVDELRRAQERMLLLGRKSPREKVASFLLMMAEQTEPGGGVDGSIDLPMRREDIGDFLGLTLETVSRTFSRFRREGTIALPSPHQVVVMRTETLDELAAGNSHAGI